MRTETKMCECGEPTQSPSGLCSMCESDGGLFQSPQPAHVPNPRMLTPEVVQACSTLLQFAADNNMGDEWSIFGLGPVLPLQRQLAKARKK